MPRLYFDVVAAGAVWQLVTDGEPRNPPVRFGAREQAMAGAIRLARAEWKAARRPTGVRVCLPGGGIHTAIVFGEDAPPTLVALAAQRATARAQG